VTRPTVLLDDDPTGPQFLRGARVLLAWSPEEIAAALRVAPSVHLVTDTRALDPGRARAATVEAARQAVAAVPGCRVVLRGDSTLRAHLVEEYDAVREVVFDGRAPVLLLVPAMPSAGRVTRGGVHHLVRDGVAVPVAETEFAGDGGFAYTSSRLLDFAEERSSGLLDAARGAEVPLARLRAEGAVAVEAALVAAGASGSPCVVAPDVETDDDLRLVLDGLELAEARGVRVVLRCSPSTAALLAVTGHPVPGAPAVVPWPVVRGGGLLVVVGSYVPGSTRQLAHLVAATGVEVVEADVDALVGTDRRVEPEAEIRRLSTRAGAGLAGPSRLAVVATPRERPAHALDLGSGGRLALGVARAAAAVHPRPDVVLTKGGVTSAVTLRDGFGVRAATVVGPLAPGISRWDAGPDLPAFVVFPGNVGADDALTHVVRHLLAGDPPVGGAPVRT
jgi:uncharacterized protein YgbK (DUF1537 family)